MGFAPEGPAGLMLGELEAGLLGGRKSSVEALLASSGGFRVIPKVSSIRIGSSRLR